MKKVNIVSLGFIEDFVLWIRPNIHSESLPEDPLDKLKLK